MSNDATGANARPVSLDAGPLGYLALGLTLLSYGLLQTGILHGAGVADAAGLAHLVGGVALFIAGLWQFRSGDTFSGTAFTGLGAFWAVWAAGAGSMAGGKNAAGLFLLLWALLALTLAVASWQAGLFGRGLYGLLTLSLLLAAIGTFGSTSGLVKVAGWLAAVAGLISWYWATAALTNSGWGRAALPVK
ncbi:acetate uptake transporter [Kitasatospora sp. GAS1066B]|uniref:acetate uptake transporter n=1 Tax=Kitasatospora sp. GAS1066B TaxID=3156271 RepID=UPI003514FBDC